MSVVGLTYSSGGDRVSFFLLPAQKQLNRLILSVSCAFFEQLKKESMDHIAISVHLNALNHTYHLKEDGHNIPKRIISKHFRSSVLELEVLIDAGL
jgi:hypothetical protein